MGEDTTARTCCDCRKPVKGKQTLRCKGCSIKHTLRSRPDWNHRYCKTCNGEIGGGNRLHATYCSKNCKFADPDFRAKISWKPDPNNTKPGRGRGRGALVTKNCPACKNDFTVGASVAERYNYCSKTCSSARGVDMTCKRCGKSFRRSQTEVRVHCSEECRRPPVLLSCLHCTRDFRVVPSESSKRRYCSAACYRASDAETTIERLVREVLDRALVGYSQQQRVGRWSVDFLVGKRLVIEADGDYWHAKRRDVDRRKDADLARSGMTVWRLPEHEIVMDGFADDLLARLAAYQQSTSPLPAADLLQSLRPTRKLSAGARRVHGPLGRPRGAAMHNAKLTDALVLELRNSVLPASELAAQYNLGRSTVGHILTGRTWKHVGGPIRAAKPVRARLSDDIVREIRASTERGVDIAARLRIDAQSVSNIRCGRAYREVGNAGLTKAA
jgi:very-short-patch-repair endonuclease